MLVGICLLSMTFAATNPIADAVNNYRNDVNTYSVTLRSKSRHATEIIKYYYKKPGFVRMEFVEPHNGALLVYDPMKKVVRLRPFNFLKSFVLNLAPDDSLVRSASGHTVAESDIGALLKRVEELQKNGDTELLGDEEVGGRRALLVAVEGVDDKTVGGTHKYLLWLEKDSLMPLRVKAFNVGGALSEDVLMDDLKINPALPSHFFEIE